MSGSVENSKRQASHPVPIKIGGSAPHSVPIKIGGSAPHSVPIKDEGNGGAVIGNAALIRAHPEVRLDTCAHCLNDVDWTHFDVGR